MSIKTDFEQLPLPVKGIIYLAGGYAIYKGGKYAWGKLNPSKEEQSVKGAKTEAEEILKNNRVLPPEQRTNATYSPSQMKLFADTLYTAMDGTGTDTTAVYGVFAKMQNDLDILNLIDAFGTRTGSSVFASSTPENLAQWLVGDGVTNDVNKILSTKARISKRF